jgi:hypothetical protein
MVLNSTSTGAVCFSASTEASTKSGKIIAGLREGAAVFTLAMFREDCVQARGPPPNLNSRAQLLQCSRHDHPCPNPGCPRDARLVAMTDDPLPLSAVRPRAATRSTLPFWCSLPRWL